MQANMQKGRQEGKHAVSQSANQAASIAFDDTVWHPTKTQHESSKIQQTSNEDPKTNRDKMQVQWRSHEHPTNICMIRQKSDIQRESRNLTIRHPCSNNSNPTPGGHIGSSACARLLNIQWKSDEDNPMNIQRRSYKAPTKFQGKSIECSSS